MQAVEGNVGTLREETHKLRAELDRERQQNQELDKEKTELEKRVEILEGQIAWFKNRLFGRKSEVLSEEERQQLRLFDEAESALQEAERELSETVIVPSHTRVRPKRRPLPEGFPREDNLVDIPDSEKRCACGATLMRIGQEVSEKLDVIPPQVRVIRTIRPKYACHVCEGSGDEGKPAVRIAAAPAALIPKGIATGGLLAHIVTGKFCDDLPLYRQEKQFQRIGVDLSRRTMADWMIRCAGASDALMEILREWCRAGPFLQLDETPVQVLKEPGRANSTKSYMWVARGGPAGSVVILYHYAPSRGAEVVEEILGEYEGYVQTDGYGAYDAVCEGRVRVVHVGCWAHCRRVYVDAKKKSTKAGSADEAIGMIGKLYAVERQRSSHPDEEEFAEWRRKQVEPVLEKLHGWLETKRKQILPGSAVGEAIQYTWNQWPKLVRYLEHPAMTPDTNAVERAIRPFVIGRKNWLFCGSPRGARASATLFSLVETAKANGLEPYWYLRRLFEGLPTAKSRADYLALAPFANPKD